MTAIDEITYRTPDALFNGEAVTGVIQSCVPSIKNAWATPSIDLDTILVAIRIASYGHEMEIGTKCPKCGEEHDFNLDLRTVIDNFRPADYAATLKKGDLEFYFRPLNYREINETSQEQFSEQKILNILPDSGLTDKERIQQINELIVKITDGTISALSKSISSIRTDDVIVTDEQQIHEFLDNCPTAMFTAIRDAAVAKRQAGSMKPLKLTCSHCNKQYDQILTLDLSNFFVPSS
jgi:hypothetical protein